MQLRFWLFLTILLFINRYAVADLKIKDVQNGIEVSTSLFVVKEGFVKLDQVNTVYGAEIVLKKGFALPTKYKIIGHDNAETDFSFMNKYTLSTVSSTEQSGTVQSDSVIDEAIETKIAVDEVRIVTGAQKTLIQDATGKTIYEIEWLPQQKIIHARNCPAQLFSLKEVKGLVSGFTIGVSCNFSVTPGLVTISVPKEVRWISTNLIEISGKGERFRTFEIPTGNLKGQASGAFRIKSSEQTLTYAVFVKKLEDKASALSIGFDKTLSMGMSSSSLSSDTASYSSSSFYYEFSGLTDYIYTYFKLGFGFFNTFAMSEDVSLISSRDSKVTLGYYSNNKSGFNYGIWLGHRNFDVKQDISSTKFQSSQFGFGGDVIYVINPANVVVGHFEMASLGSKVVKSHMKIGGTYKRRFIFGKTELNIGGLFQMQDMQMATAAGDSRKYGLTKFGVSLDF